MKLYSRVRGHELIDSFVFRVKAESWQRQPNVVGVLVPFGKRAMMVYLRRRRLSCSFPYMRREDALKAAYARYDKRQESL